MSTSTPLGCPKNLKEMRKERVTVFFDRKGKAEKSGVGKIELQIYLAWNQRKWVTVGKAKPDEWQVESQSTKIRRKIQYYEGIIQAMEMLDEEMTIENFNKHTLVDIQPKGKMDKTHFYNGHDQRQNFYDFCLDYSTNNEKLKANTWKHFKTVFDAVEESGIIKTFADLTPTNIRAFDSWLHSKGDKTDVTIYGYHKRIKKYTRILWREEMISVEPYEHLKFNRGTFKERVPLTEDEIIKIRDAHYEGRLDRARDLFIFMAYTGLAYCDMAIFDYKTMTEKSGDTMYIDGERLKTGSKFYTPILPPAMAVLKKYNYKLPVISNQKLNDFLLLVETDLKIKKRVSCHVARHSFATLMLSYNVPIEKTARMLGHKDIKTTQIYAKILKKNVEDQVDVLVPKLR